MSGGLFWQGVKCIVVKIPPPQKSIKQEKNTKTKRKGKNKSTNGYIHIQYAYKHGSFKDRLAPPSQSSLKWLGSAI